MTRKKTAPLRDEAREQEVLDSIINPSGTGEDPAVKAMLADSFAVAPDREAADVMLRIQQLIMGQNSLLQQVADGVADADHRLQQLEARMSKYDEAAQKFETDREKWLEETLAEGRRTLSKYDSLQQAELQAQGGKMMSDAIAMAHAKSGADRVEFELMLANQPKETIMSPGKFVSVREGESIVSKHIPEEVRIKHKRWVLPIGVPVEVPKLVADVYRKQQRVLEEMRAREALLSKNPESVDLRSAWDGIGRKYGTAGQPMPGGD